MSAALDGVSCDGVISYRAGKWKQRLSVSAAALLDRPWLIRGERSPNQTRRTDEACQEHSSNSWGALDFRVCMKGGWDTALL